MNVQNISYSKEHCRQVLQLCKETVCIYDKPKKCRKCYKSFNDLHCLLSHIKMHHVLLRKPEDQKFLGKVQQLTANTPCPVQPAPAALRKEDCPEPIRRYRSYMGCVRTRPCLSCFNCKDGKVDSCFKLFCTEIKMQNTCLINYITL